MIDTTNLNEGPDPILSLLERSHRNYMRNLSISTCEKSIFLGTKFCCQRSSVKVPRSLHREKVSYLDEAFSMVMEESHYLKREKSFETGDQPDKIKIYEQKVHNWSQWTPSPTSPPSKPG